MCRDHKGSKSKPFFIVLDRLMAEQEGCFVPWPLRLSFREKIGSARFRELLWEEIGLPELNGKVALVAWHSAGMVLRSVDAFGFKKNCDELDRQGKRRDASVATPEEELEHVGPAVPPFCRHPTYRQSSAHICCIYN